MYRALIVALVLTLASPAWAVDSIILLNAVTEDTTSASFSLPLLTHQSNSDVHEYSITVSSSDFGSGTVRIEFSIDGGSNWFVARTPSDAQATFTQSDQMRVVVPRGGLLRARLSGSTNPAALTVRAL